MNDRITLPRPTAAELTAALSPSAETEQVRIAKPVHNYLTAKLHDRTTVDAYVSDRITSELVRLSKMKGGGNHTGWKVSNEQRAANARSRWSRTERVKSVRVRVFDEPHKAYIGMSDRKGERTRIAGDVILEWCEAIDRDSVLEYCASHRSRPGKFVTIPQTAVDAAKRIANDLSVPFTKIICYILSNET